MPCSAYGHCCVSEIGWDVSRQEVCYPEHRFKHFQEHSGMSVTLSWKKEHVYNLVLNWPRSAYLLLFSLFLFLVNSPWYHNLKLFITSLSSAKYNILFIWKISLQLLLWQIPSQMVFLYLFNALIGFLFCGDQS